MCTSVHKYFCASQIRMYVYMNDICMYVLCVCMCMCMFTCTVYLCVHVYVYVCVYVCVCVCVHVRLCVREQHMVIFLLLITTYMHTLDTYLFLYFIIVITKVYCYNLLRT